MRPAVQLALDLGVRPALGREDFLVAPVNAEAVAWIDCWPDWPGPALALAGPPGCGKTHLGRVWQARSDAVALAADAVAGWRPDMFGGRPPHCIIEDAGRTGDEAALFHLYNFIADGGGTLLLTADTAPARWQIRLPDLASRLRAAPVAEIALPDDAVIEAVLVKLFADRQLRPAPAVVSFLVARMERSYAAARSIVATLDKHAMAGGRPVTIPLAREVLEQGAP